MFQFEHDKFTEGTKDKMQEVIANFDGTCREMLRETLFSMLENGVENKSKTNGHEFNREDVEDAVDFVAEQLKHEVMTLSGKGKQVEFSVATWEIAHSLCSKSKANFREHKKISPLHCPSTSSMNKAMAENKVSDGRCPKAHEMRNATKQANGERTECCYAMCDEIQTKDGVTCHSATGSSLGLENDMIDLSTVLHRLLSDDKGGVHKAKKASQWLLVRFGTDKFQSWHGKFFQ